MGLVGARVALLGGVAVSFWANPVLSAPPPVRATAPSARAATGTAPSSPPRAPGCTLELEGGPRGGITVNDDQWIVGGHLRLGLLCLGGLALEPVALLGFGGNYLTLRPSLRAIYRLYSDTNRELELHPALGYSLVQWLPVGQFADWCDRLEVDACYARDSGVELGGGIAYRFLGLDAVAGFGSLPVVTITLTATFPMLRGTP